MSITHRWHFQEEAGTATLAPAVGAVNGALSSSTTSELRVDGPSSVFPNAQNLSSVRAQLTDLATGHKGDFSVALWFKITSTVNNGELFSAFAGSSNQAFILRQNGTNMLLEWRVSRATGPVGSVVGSTTLSTDQWYHVVATSADNKLNLYLDGEPEASATPSSTGDVLYDGAHFTVGSRPNGGQSAAGHFADAVVANHEMNVSEAAALYAEGSDLGLLPLAAYYYKRMR